MDLTDVTIPYEILIRFGDDGAFKGAHQVRRRVVTLAGEVLKDDELPAEPIEPTGMGAIMGEANARAVAAATLALAERDAAIAARDAAVSERETMLRDRDAAILARDAAVTERDAAIADRDAAHAAVSELRSRLAAAETALTEARALSAASASSEEGGT